MHFSKLFNNNTFYGAQAFVNEQTVFSTYFQLQNYQYVNASDTNQVFELVLVYNVFAFAAYPYGYNLGNFTIWSSSFINQNYNYQKNVSSYMPCMVRLGFVYYHGSFLYDGYLQQYLQQWPVVQKLTLINANIESYATVFGTDGVVTAQRTEVIVYNCVMFSYQRGGPTPTVNISTLFAPSIINFIFVDTLSAASLINLQTVYAPQLQYLTINFAQTDNTTFNFNTTNFSTQFPSLKVLEIDGPFSLTGLLSNTFYWCQLTYCVFRGYIDMGLIVTDSCCTLLPLT